MNSTFKETWLKAEAIAADWSEQLNIDIPTHSVFQVINEINKTDFKEAAKGISAFGKLVRLQWTGRDGSAKKPLRFKDIAKRKFKIKSQCQ